MTERTHHLPPQVCSILARQVALHRPVGVIALSNLLEAVRPICPDTFSDRALEDAIAEEAVLAGLVVHFDHTTHAGAYGAEKQA